MAQLNVHGGDIYSLDCRLDFSANTNPMGMPEAVARAACESIASAEHYPDTRCRKLRRALALHHRVPEDRMIFGNGAAELIYGLIFALKPKKSLLAVPSFAEYEEALQMCGCGIEYYELKEENTFALQEDYLAHITEEIDLIFLCNPNNPTGVMIEPQLLSRIADRCHEKHVTMILDECFLELTGQAHLRSMIRRLEDTPELFILRAFTKSFAMAGLRLGYGMCSDTELLASVKRYIQPWSVSVPAQEAGLAAVTECDGYLEESRALIERERMFLMSDMRRLGLHVFPGEANYLFFKGPEGLAEKCRAQGILIRDCGNYVTLRPGYYRVAVRTHEENEELIRTLKEVLQF